MRLHPFDIAVLGAYLAGMFAIGVACARAVRTQKDLFLGGRRFGKFMLTFQTFGIGTHSEQVVAVVGQCYRVGLAGIWWQFMWMFCTPVYWMSHTLLRRMRVMTTADYWAERFSPGLATLSAVSGLFQVVFTIATLLKAMGTVLESVTQGAVPTSIVIPVCAGLFVFYTVLGGLYAATITDLVQGILTIVLSLILLPFIFAKTGGMAGIHRALDPGKFSYVIPEEMTLFFVIMLSINALVGVYTGPHTVTNAGSGRHEWDVRVGTMAGTLLKRICTVAWAFLGLGALALYPGLEHEEHAFGKLVRELLPPGLVGLMVAAILAGCMSAGGALMLAGSSLITKNLYAPRSGSRGERHYVAVGRLSACLVVAVSAYVAFRLPNVLEGLKQVWAVCAFMGLAWWAGVIWPRTTPLAAWASTIVTTVAYLVTLAYNALNQHFSGWRDLAYPEQIATYLSLGLIALIVTSRVTTHPNPAAVRRFYRKMRTPTTQPSEFDAED